MLYCTSFQRTLPRFADTGHYWCHGRQMFKFQTNSLWEIRQLEMYEAAWIEQVPARLRYYRTPLASGSV